MQEEEKVETTDDDGKEKSTHVIKKVDNNDGHKKTEDSGPKVSGSSLSKDDIKEFADMGDEDKKTASDIKDEVSDIKKDTESNKISGKNTNKKKKHIRTPHKNTGLQQESQKALPNTATSYDPTIQKVRRKKSRQLSPKEHHHHHRREHTKPVLHNNKIQGPKVLKRPVVESSSRGKGDRQTNKHKKDSHVDTTTSRPKGLQKVIRKQPGITKKPMMGCYSYYITSVPVNCCWKKTKIAVMWFVVPEYLHCMPFRMVALETWLLSV